MIKCLPKNFSQQRKGSRGSRPRGVRGARYSELTSQVGKQMTSAMDGAPTSSSKEWHAIDWQKAQKAVRRLQRRIAQALLKKRFGKAKALCRILARSFYAKVLAVKRVTSNKGKNTPGVDGIIWKGAKTKFEAVCNLHHRGYKAQPLRRIYIPKKDGSKRPLSIPTLKDRAMQALHKLALAPFAETFGDPNSYGFRELRSCADAIAMAFNALSKPNSATWVLEADITGCYD